MAALSALIHLGLENNHALGGGTAGQSQTQQVLWEHSAAPVKRGLTITRTRGVPVAWIAFFDGGHALSPLAASREGVQGAQVVVGVHWGMEYGPVTARQRRLARELAAAGADLIVGSRPRVLQGHGRIGTALVMYSLGNLLLDQPCPDARIGAVVRVTQKSAGWSASAVVPAPFPPSAVRAASRPPTGPSAPGFSPCSGWTRAGEALALAARHCTCMRSGTCARRSTPT